MGCLFIAGMIIVSAAIGTIEGSVYGWLAFGCGLIVIPLIWAIALLIVARSRSHVRS